VPVSASTPTLAGWIPKHSFSFGHHYDRTNTHHGLLLVSNDDKVAAGTGFDTHPHRDMEIVTWVLNGSLVHKDSEGNSGILYPNLAQRMSAGTGILHSEKNDSWTIDWSAARNPGALCPDVGGS
jgi:quercetin 2,3-dioxygenase